MPCEGEVDGLEDDDIDLICQKRGLSGMRVSEILL
jgi:hypothetical protein